MAYQETKRRYFEIWGDIETQNRTLKVLLLAQLFLLFLSLVFSFLVGLKPPAVIRVSEVGEAEVIRGLKNNNAVSEVEIIHFAKNFLKEYTSYNAYTITEDLQEALNMMTGRYQKAAQKEMLESGLAGQIKEGELYAKVTIREAKIEKNQNDFAIVSVLGVRKIMSYKLGNFKEESLFKADVTLKKVSRTLDIPYGLLVEDYREVLVKEIE